MTTQAPPRPRSREAGRSSAAEHRQTTMPGMVLGCDAEVSALTDAGPMQRWGQDLRRLWWERSDSATMVPWWLGVVGIVVMLTLLLLSGY